MKVSRKWLQKYFEKELPSTAELAEALTFHAFEIEESTDDVLDVKVLPDRASYALSHRGIAKELSAILDIPLKYDPFTEAIPEWSSTQKLHIDVDSAYVLRHTGAIVRGVKVGPSPAWLKEALEAIGQRSINNIVDATNYVMNDIGQPMHAFDAGKMTWDKDTLRVDIRKAKQNEKITILTGEVFTLTDDMYVIADATSGTALDIAGLKGGKSSGVTEETTDLFVSVGNYDGTSIRKMAQSLKLFTDASTRYQNRPSPELTAYGMRDILALIQAVAGGTAEDVLDVYPVQQDSSSSVSFTVGTINEKLGASFTKEEIVGVFQRLGFDTSEEGSAFVVSAPFERRDIQIPEDVVEEVGRILGYDRIEPVALPPADSTVDLARYRGIERVKDFLTERGFTEISTPSFAGAGEIMLANPLQEEKPYLRADLAGNMQEAVTRGVYVAPRVLGPVTDVRLFEVGTVFEKDGERLSLALGYAPLAGKKQKVLEEIAGELSSLLNLSLSVGADGVLEVPLGEVDLEKLGAGYAPRDVSLQKYKEFSLYPFALRDIAVWTPEGTTENEVIDVILKEAGDTVARIDLFDRFEKEGRISYAFRIVFESFEKTLSDVELVPAMERITHALQAKEGWEVR